MNVAPQPNRWPQMGQLLLEQGRLSRMELDSALEEQQQTSKPLGEILVAREHISRVELAAILSKQWTWPQAQPEDEPTPTPDEQAAAPEQPEASTGPAAELEARVETLEGLVGDLTKAFGALQRVLHAKTQELEAMRTAPAQVEEPASALAVAGA